MNLDSDVYAMFTECGKKLLEPLKEKPLNKPGV